MKANSGHSAVRQVRDEVKSRFLWINRESTISRPNASTKVAEDVMHPDAIKSAEIFMHAQSHDPAHRAHNGGQTL